MKPVPVFIALFSASGAQADPGHLIEVAGHNHWLGGAALGGALLAGLWGALKGKRNAKQAGEAGSEEPQEV